jgi:hypothetical protein
MRAIACNISILKRPAFSGSSNQPGRIASYRPENWLTAYYVDGRKRYFQSQLLQIDALKPKSPGENQMKAHSQQYAQERLNYWAYWSQFVWRKK